ncbi:MAG: ribonuclease D [Desulfosudaceae bacterium]
MSDTGTTGRPFQMIDTDAALKEIIPTLKRQKALGFDLEADSMFHFTEKVCLLQIAAGKRSFLVDPLVVKDLSPLKTVFADASIKKIFHGADYDIRSLHRDFGITIDNLFDTEVACRFLGFPESGLNSLVQRVIGASLEKKYQKSDWSQRPLPPEMMNYATGDVIYLEALYRELKARLREKGREAWVDEECRLLCAVRCAEANDQPLFKKIKGAGRLDRRGLAVLERLLRLRLDIARQKDRPPFKVMSNASLFQVADVKPRNRERLIATGAFSRKQVSMYADRICRAVNAALSLSEKRLPVYPRERRPGQSPQMVARVNALKQWRQKTARTLEIDPGVLFPNALLMTVAQTHPQDRSALDELEDLKNWQKAEFGEELVAVMKSVP